MASPHYEIQLLKNAGLPDQEIINRVDVFMPWEMAFGRAEAELQREPKADGVRVVDDLNHVVFERPERV